MEGQESSAGLEAIQPYVCSATPVLKCQAKVRAKLLGSSGTMGTPKLWLVEAQKASVQTTPFAIETLLCFRCLY